MYCADKEVDLVMKGGNYGWRVFKGPLLFNPSSTPGGNTSADAINAIARGGLGGEGDEGHELAPGE